MNKIALILFLVFSSFTASATPFEDLSTQVRNETGIKFHCTENVRHRRCMQILEGLLKYKKTLIKLRKDIPIFSVSIGQSTTLAGGDGILVPFDRSPEEILAYLEAQSPMGLTCLPPESPGGSSWTCQGACCGYALTCFAVIGCTNDRPKPGLGVSFDEIMGSSLESNDQITTAE